ncbi:mitochondrial carrier domain-containing protein [Pilobolus umbonatus]|nr:mitochondrial carrier domain-containing protein [Pilobolus umbonatus]
MTSHVTSSQLNAAEIALSGGIAGFATRFAISPLDVVKIRLQVQPSLQAHRNLLPSIPTKHALKYSSIGQTFKTIIAEEGLRGLFKGNVSAQYLYITYGASQFYVYHHVDSFLNRLQFYPSFKPFVSGLLAGGIATAMTYPFDLLRTRFALQGNNKVYRSIPHAVSDIYEKEGIRGFYRGLGSSIVQIMPYMGLMFYTYEGLCTLTKTIAGKNMIRDDYKRLNDMTCGALAGIVSKTGVFPLDLVRKRLQVQGPHINNYVITSIPDYAHHNSLIGCMKKIVRTEGVWALYKGLTPGLLKAGPSGAVYFLVFEWSKDCLIAIKKSGFQIIPEDSFLKY